MPVPIATGDCGIVGLWDSNTNVTDQCMPQREWNVKLRLIFWMMTVVLGDGLHDQEYAMHAVRLPRIQSQCQGFND